MDPRPPALPSFIIKALLLLCIALGVMSVIVSRPSQPEASSATPPPNFDAQRRAALTHGITQVLMDLELNEADLEQTQPLYLHSPEGPRAIEHLAIYLPSGADPQALQRALEKLEIPGLTWLYEEGHDLSFSLEARLEGIPTLLIELTPPFHPAGPDPLGDPYPVALMLSGLGPTLHPFDAILTSTQALSLAIEPYTPYALEWGEEGLAAGKEIWVDLGAAPRGWRLGDQERARDVLEAVPNAEGIYLPRHTSLGRLQKTGIFKLLRESRWGALLGGPRLMALAQAAGTSAAQPYRLDLPGRGWSERELARLLALAQRDGVAIGVIDASATSPESILYWLQGIGRLGFEPIGVREAMSLIEQGRSDAARLSKAQGLP